MAFEDEKNNLENHFIRLPNEKIIHTYALKALEYNGGYYSLTNEEEDEAKLYNVYGNNLWEIPKSVLIEYEKKTYTFESKEQLKINDTSSIELPKHTLDILNGSYYEMFLKKKFEKFKKLLGDFIEKYEDDYTNQLLLVFEEISIDVKFEGEESTNILNLDVLKFKDIIRREQKETKKHIKNQFDKFTNHWINEIEYNGIKAYKGMSYSTLKKTYKFLKAEINDYSRASYIYHKLKDLNLISSEKYSFFAEWLYQSNFITESIKKDIITENNQFKSFKNSAPIRNDSLFYKVFKLPIT